MIKVLVVPKARVQKAVAQELARAERPVCLAFTLEAQKVKGLAKKGSRVVVLGSSEEADVRISPDNLSVVAVTIQQVMQSMAVPRFLVVEGFSELALRGVPDTTRRFALFLAAGLRSWGVDAVFVVAKEAGAGSVLPVLMQAADEVVSGKGQ